jgi:hypothetical protein
MNVAELAIDTLRDAVHNNFVSFPAQVPAFPKLARADLQCKLVQLYFLRGWSSESIGKRYGITRERVRQILTQWKARAVFLGLIQYIPPVESSVVPAEATAAVIPPLAPAHRAPAVMVASAH